MKQLRYIGAVCLAFVLGAFASCTNDPLTNENQLPSDGGGTRELRLNVVVPDNSTYGEGTRAISATEENIIQTVSVLAFKIDGANETFDYAVTASLDPANVAGSATQTFVASLQVQSYQQRFVVVTNASSLVGAQAGNSAKGTAKATVLANLQYDYASNQDRWAANASYNYGPMPMWGESAAETITSTTRAISSTVYLMRMVARIDVKLDTSVAGLTNQFKMKSVALYNTNRGGRMVPDASKVVTEQRGGQTYLRVNAPTIPTSYQPYSARTLGPINYTDFTAPGTTDVAMIGAIYTFETAAATTAAEATCLVVGGLYGSDTTPTYYRVELFAAGTQNRLDILRNHQYVVNITAVNGRGYATAAAAFASPPVNMTAQTLAWAYPGMDNIAINGQTYLATDKRQVNLWSNTYNGALSSGENTLQVITDVPAGWQVGSITDTNGAAVTWARVTTTSGPVGTKTSTIVNADANNGAERTAIINFVAGRLTLPVRVVQSNQSAIALTITDGTNEISELVFTNSNNTRAFTVNWLPASNAVTVPTVTQVAQYEFPNPGANPAVQDNAPYLNMPWPTPRTGAWTFANITPPALTAAEIAANPFITKASRFDFTINNGFTTLTKSITLRQLNYALLVEPTNALVFPMDGQRYAYNVRSNSTFRIRSVTETPRVAGTKLIADHTGLDNVYTGATGGPVTTPGGGWREYLTTNNANRGGSGYADVTYESDKANVTFANGTNGQITRRLFFPAAQFNIFSICLKTTNATDPRVYSFWSGNGPSTPPNSDHDVHTMMNGPTNYNANTTGTGTSDTFSSTVPVNGIGTYGLWVGGTTSASSSGATYSGTTITTAMINAAVAANADMLVISGDSKIPWNSGADLTVAQSIYDNFLAKDKPVFFACDDGDSILALFVVLRNNGKASGDMQVSTGLNGRAAVYQYRNIADPILDRPFPVVYNNVTQSSLQGRYWGDDGDSAPGFWFTRPDDNIVMYSTMTNVVPNGTSNTPSGLNNVTWANGTTEAGSMANGTSCFRFKNAPLIVANCGGYLASADQSYPTGYPTSVNTTTKVPQAKIYTNGGQSWNVHNSVFIANTVAWAIQRRTTQ